jgi:hypothetical protein
VVDEDGVVEDGDGEPEVVQAAPAKSADQVRSVVDRIKGRQSKTAA